MTKNNVISVLLVDDHMVVRKGLGLVLDTSDEFEIIGEASSGEEALHLCNKLNPEIVLMDAKMKGIGGTEAAKLITEHRPSTKVIGLSTFANQEIVSGMFHAGVRGYLLKDISANDLISAMRRVHVGEIVRPEEYSDMPEMMNSPTGAGQISEDTPVIGEQQKRVLALMTKGLTNPEIAVQMDVSISTIRYHVSAILRKLDVSNRSEAVALAVRLQLTSQDDL